MLLRLVWAGSALIFAVCTLITLVLAFPLQLVALPWDRDRRVAGAVTRWTWGVAHFFVHPLWRVRITGRERLGGRGRILVANHQSMLDIPALFQLPVSLRLTARPGVFALPVYGRMARFGGHLCVDPEADLSGLVDRVRGLLDRGISVVIFPEGTRGDGARLLPFKRGAFELAIRVDAEVQPVVIRGTINAMEPGTAFSRVFRPQIELHVLPPLSPIGATRRSLAREARSAMEATFAGPSPLHVPQELFALYRPVSAFAAGFARWKTDLDPAFWAAWQRLPREGVVVDLGAGEGLLGAYLRACGSTVTIIGFDLDEARIQRARAVSSPGDVYHVGDARTAPLPAGAAAVVALDLLHYLPAPEQDALIERMAGALAPGGMLLIRDPEVRGGFTVLSERLMVAMGRHQGAGVEARGAGAIAARVRRHFRQVEVEDCSAGPFRNTLITAVAPPRGPGV
ncbi:hypothetical protein LBMAG42_41500 [Deltaproteobacteria bacterium]|nr:hypothetical protein LBMAG42_41500 [Deltaproteobacteria bacterium]